MIEQISFKNYKAFSDEQTLDLAPITILMGKNSYGKSTVARLPVLLQHMFFDKNRRKSPVKLKFGSFDFGDSFIDLLYNKYETRPLKFGLKFNEQTEIDVVIRYYSENKRVKIEEYSVKHKDQALKMSLTNAEKRERTIVFDKISYENELILFKSFQNVIDSRIKRQKTALTDSITDFLEKAFKSIELNVSYIKPVRKEIQSLYARKAFMEDDAVDLSDDAPYLLAEEKQLLKNVSNWYCKNFGIEEIEVEQIKGDFFTINVKINEGVSVNLKQVGYGVGQSLPIVTRAFMDRKNYLDIIEQPELHLHPGAHGCMAELLVFSAKKNENSKFIIETHSENFILRLRRLIAEKEIPPEFVNIYWVDFDKEERKSTLVKINIDERGDVDFWPSGIFSEDFEEIKAIRRAQRNEKEK